jgi:hypothetical protein
MRQLLMAIAVAAASAAPAAADTTFRCESGRLARLGDRMYEVEQKCGDPDFVTQRTEKRTVKHKVRRFIGGVWEEFDEEREVDVLIDEWTYDLGPEHFVRYVSFENGRVCGIGTGNYGRKR